MMKQCYQAVLSAAAGRNISKAEVQNIFDNILKNQQKLARSDPEWQTLPAEEKLQRAAELGINEAIHQKQLKQKRVALTILARNRLDNQISTMVKSGAVKNEIEALNRIVSYHADNKSGVQSMDTRAHATSNWAMGQLIDAWDASKALGLFEDKKAVENVVRELYGENTGDAKARAIAKTWGENAELLKTTFNNAGGDIGTLDNWRLPQEHSQIKSARAGAQKWLDDILPEIDRRKYVNPDGTPMSDVEVKALFTEMYKTISTGGINKLQGEGIRVSSMVANRRGEARQIHFKDADSFLRYHAKYGERGVFDIMMGHINGLSRDIAAVETFGPNPNLMFRSVLEDSLNHAVEANPVKKNDFSLLAEKTTKLYDFTAGNYKPVARSFVAKVFDSVRSLITGARLGSAALAAIGDQGTLLLMARTNGVATGPMYRGMIRSLNPLSKTDRRFAQRNGLALESATSSLVRFGVDNMNTNWTHKTATAVLRLSGLMKISDAAKEGYATSMMSSLGHVVKNNADFNTLHKTSKFDAELIKRHGVTDGDFAIWKLAELETHHGVADILTPESVMKIPNEKLQHLGNPESIRFESARKLIGMLSEESDVAVITPGTRDRIRMGADTQRGTFPGEIVRSVTQFKAFPFALAARMWARGSSLPTGLQKAHFGGSLLLGTTLFGAAALQINDVVSGREPRDMTTGEFWIEAMLKGGALGVYGDFIFANTNDFGQTLGETAIGPLGGAIAQLANLTIGNTKSLVAGDDTTFGADAVKLVKGLTPGANLWYTKAITDHMLFNQAQELVSPGYLKQYTNRQKNTYKTKYWWEPKDIIPGG